MISKLIPLILKKTNIAILGGGGVGKTYLTREIIKILTQLKIKVGITASTGLAATHLDGMTIHRYSGIGGLSSKEDFYKLYHSKEWDNIRIRLSTTDVLIIDEISMLRSDTFEFLNYVCQMALRRPNLPFGGLQLVVVGDFLQLPPVVKQNEFFTSPWAFQTEAWKDADFKICYLDVVKRQNEKEFIDALQEIRMGKTSVLTDKIIKERIDAPLEKLNVEPIRLMSLNNAVKKYNDQRINELNGTPIISGAKSWYREPRIWYELKREVNAEEILELKTGCQVIITANSRDGFYVNGSMGRLLGTFDADPAGGTLMERLYSGLKIELTNGDIVSVPMKKWTLMDRIPKEIFEQYNRLLNDGPYIPGAYKEAENLIQPYMKGWFIQWPVRPAYAITIHKSQGMTLEQVEFHGKQIFTEAQAYVGLSRAKNLKGLSIKNWSPWCIRANKQAIEFYNSLLH